MRGATIIADSLRRLVQFQSTLPMRGATFSISFFSDVINISIHTPHAGSDLNPLNSPTVFLISIHTPHAGSDDRIFWTLPLFLDFNPHSPCGERLSNCFFLLCEMCISIHTPHAGSDNSFYSMSTFSFHFNPHSPCGERPCTYHPPAAYVSDFNPHSPCGERQWAGPADANGIAISIHTPHAGSDVVKLPDQLHHQNFNPHSPCGERQYLPCVLARRSTFQSTLPMRGATVALLVLETVQIISIHTPHAGSDSKSYRIHIKFKNKIYDIRNKNKL